MAAAAAAAAAAEAAAAAAMGARHRTCRGTNMILFCFCFVSLLFILSCDADFLLALRRRRALKQLSQISAQRDNSAAARKEKKEKMICLNEFNAFKDDFLFFQRTNLYRILEETFEISYFSVANFPLPQFCMKRRPRRKRRNYVRGFLGTVYCLTIYFEIIRIIHF